MIKNNAPEGHELRLASVRTDYFSAISTIYQQSEKVRFKITPFLEQKMPHGSNHGAVFVSKKFTIENATCIDNVITTYYNNSRKERVSYGTNDN